VYDFGKKVIMSGLVDANVNVCSGSNLEDFTTATKAAAAGGVTTIIDNPMWVEWCSTKRENSDFLCKFKVLDSGNNVSEESQSESRRGSKELLIRRLRVLGRRDWRKQR
jgi:hypothetical protein